MPLVPLFPLHTVLFPGMTLPLRIFEPRYLKMVAECQEKQHGFGVCLIREGSEVGGGAQPYDIGTLGEMSRISTLPGGQLFLVAQGARRFRVRELFPDRHAWLSGEVEMLEEDDVPADFPLALQVQALAQRYLELLRLASGKSESISISASTSNDLSWAVAASLMIAPPAAQKLLEIDATRDRLQVETELLQEHIRVLEARLAARPHPFSNN